MQTWSMVGYHARINTLTLKNVLVLKDDLPGPWRSSFESYHGIRIGLNIAAWWQPRWSPFPSTDGIWVCIIELGAPVFE
ncbi:hypothetical protein HanRHA438_Chr07g0295631 [Helianthus annuus]|nr:hypothetical protein HanIR_Chr07g0307231 [Helianthus annuus]KAJ0907164.1 hypothetical protein HanRHA438_Chr07g0295631 [Helianthus annuus]